MVQGVMASIAGGTLTPVPPAIEMGGGGNSSHFAEVRIQSSSVPMSWALTEEKEWVAVGININAAP